MDKKMTLRKWLALITVYIAWGSTYLAIRFAVESLPPFFMAGTRLSGRRIDRLRLAAAGR